jgi:RNA polymerase sigma factor (sigma-70 family)
LVSQHQRLVHLVVNRYLKRYIVPSMEREDLVSWGLIGLVHAARAWNPERGASFSTLACRAIERMIIRGVRREWKPDQAAATVSLDDLVTGEDTTTQKRFVDLLVAAQNVEADLLLGETQAVLRSAVAKLPAPQRRLIEHHYYEDVPVARLAEEWGLSTQGLYARQRQALRQLRAALAVAAEAP